MSKKVKYDALSSHSTSKVEYRQYEEIKNNTFRGHPLGIKPLGNSFFDKGRYESA